MAAIAHDVGALLFVDMAHIAGLVAAGVHPSPFPHADIVTTTTHKTLRGPRGGMIFSRATSCPTRLDAGRLPGASRGVARPPPIDRNVFPGIQGGPLMHVIAGKAVAFKLAAEEPFREDQRRTVANAQVLAETLAEPGRAGRLGRHRQPPHARRRDAARGDRQGGRAPPRRDRDHRQQERASRSTRCRRTPRRASASGTPATTSRGFGDGRDARRRPDHHRGDPRRATTRPSSAASPARSARSWSGSRSRGCPPRDRVTHSPPAPRDLHPDVGSAVGPIVVVFVAAALLALVLTPLVRRIVIRYEIVDRPEARRVNTVPMPRGRRARRRGRVPARRAASFLLAQRAARSSIPCRSTIAADGGRGAAPRRRGRGRRSAPSTTCSTCAPAGSCSARSRWRCWRGRARHQHRLHRQPVRAGRHPVQRARSRPASRSSGSSG